MLRQALQTHGMAPDELDGAQLAEARAQVAREMVIHQDVLASGMAGDVHVSKAEMAAAMDELRARYADEDAFLADLRRHGLDAEGLAQALARELRVSVVLDRVGQQAPEVAEDEVREYYDRHRDRFAYPETREARHILVTINDAFPENRREVALKRIRDIARDIGGDAGRFGELAAACSECPTAMQQGMLGRVRPGQLYPELDAALFAMDEGEIVGPIETEIGLHLLYCEAIHAAGKLDYAQAAARIRERLREIRARHHQRSWLASLRDKAVADGVRG